MKARRDRSLTAVLQNHLSVSSSQGTLSTGGTKFLFTPDSSKMVMASATTAILLVIDLGSEKPGVLRRFDQHRKVGSISGGRLVRGSTKSQTKHENHDTDDNGDLSSPPSIVQMAVSPDGQWLASSDDRGQTFVYNLDSLQVISNICHPVVLPLTHST